ncbi:MAG: hypothetical protein OHK0015_18300 [Chloroflexi bacterium OHK40]
MVRHRHVLVVVTLLLAGLASGLLLASNAYLDAAFPGATRTGSDTMVNYANGLAIKRTSAFRTDAPFSEVYTWYSQRYSLGPEAHAQGGCILMGRSFTTLGVIKEQITVTVCGTPNGQMMFVTRSSVLPYGHLLPW